MTASASSPESSTSRRRFLTGRMGSPGVRRSMEEGGGYWIRVHRRAMACRFEITLDLADGAFVGAATAALDEIDRLEDELSVFRGTSAISEINRRAAREPVAVP